MEKYHIKLKSNLITLILPILSKYLFYNLIFFLILLLIKNIISFTFLEFYWSNYILLLPLITFILMLSFLDLIIINNLFTTYYFFENHIEKKFNFFIEKSTSISYSQITNIHLNKDLLDKIFKTGDLIISTGNDSFSEGKKTYSMKIIGVSHPEKVKSLIANKVKHK